MWQFTVQMFIMLDQFLNGILNGQRTRQLRETRRTNGESSMGEIIARCSLRVRVNSGLDGWSVTFVHHKFSWPSERREEKRLLTHFFFILIWWNWRVEILSRTKRIVEGIEQQSQSNGKCWSDFDKPVRFSIKNTSKECSPHPSRCKDDQRKCWNKIETRRSCSSLYSPSPSPTHPSLVFIHTQNDSFGRPHHKITRLMCSCAISVSLCSSWWKHCTNLYMYICILSVSSFPTHYRFDLDPHRDLSWQRVRNREVIFPLSNDWFSCWICLELLWL